MDHIPHFLDACEQGDYDTVSHLIDQGVNVDWTDETGTTALQVACANGHEHIIQLLLMKGAALDKSNCYRWTPLLHAARHGHSNIIMLLLQNKADLLATNRLNTGALTLAARGGHLQTVRMLVELGIDLNSCGTTCEFTPLMAAAQYGHDAVVRYLLDRGSDVNYRMPSTGLNALMLAAVNGYMTTAQILIERGCDPNLTNVNNMTALDVATNRGKREVRGYLDRKTTNKPKVVHNIKPDIINASKSGDIHRVREILNEDLTQRDTCSPEDGATPLMFAAMTGRLDIAQLLVENGCDINKQDNISAWTALMQATYHGKKNVALFLLNAGADVSIQAKNGCTAFDMASLIDDVDKDLFQILASKTMGGPKAQEKKIKSSWSAKNGGSANGAVSNEPGAAEDKSKGGLKAWWNRLSNRFHNLRFGQTFRKTSNKLAPLPENGSGLPDTTLKGNATPTYPSSDSPHKSSLDPSMTLQSISSYELSMLETKKNAFTLGINSTHSNLPSDTLKPVIPPFFPAPSFDMGNSDRSRMPPVQRPRSLDGGPTGMPSRPFRPTKLLQAARPNSSLSTSPASPSNSGRFNFNNNPSPSSSGGASGISGFYNRPITGRLPSSASATMLHSHGDNLNKSGSSGSGIHLTDVQVHSRSDSHDSVFLPTVRSTGSLVGHGAYGSRSSSPAYHRFSNTTSPNSSTSGSSSLTPRKPKSKSTSSRGSTTSTLTPSPSPTPGKTQDNPGSGSRVNSSQQKNVVPDDDDLGGILKKLSLEIYQPIFEEQEVDMEAFLTLSDGDLKELGISNVEPRRQILSAITELNSGKGRERQRLHETMTSFQTTLNNRNSFPAAGGSLASWSLQEEPEQGEPSAKTRSS